MMARTRGVSRTRSGGEIPLEPNLAPAEDRNHLNGMETLGVGGAEVFSGYVANYESDSRLAGPGRYRLFSEIIANVDIIATAIRYTMQLVSRVGWTFDKANDTPEADEFAEFCEEAIYDLETPWSRVIRKASTYRLYGFSVQEWTAKRRPDGKVGFLDVETRPAATIERWDLAKSGKPLGVFQVDPNSQRELYIPRAKLAYIVDDSLNDSPEGLGLLRNAYRKARRLERLEQLEGVGFETDLRGIPIARIPMSDLRALQEAQKITSDQRSAMESPIRSFLSNHVRTPDLGLLLDSAVHTTADGARSPSGVYKWSVDLIKGSSAGLNEAHQSIERQTRQLARLWGIEGLLLGEKSTGSMALSRDKSTNLATIIHSVLTDIAEAYEVDLLRPLAWLNGVDRSLVPTLKPDSVHYRDIEQVTKALVDLSAASLDQNDPADDKVRDLVGMPRRIRIEDDGLPDPVSPAKGQLSEDGEMDNSPTDSAGNQEI